MKIVKVKLRDGARPPRYSTAEASGADLMSIVDMIVKARQHALIPTGCSVELPDGYEAQVRPRSGLALRNGITVLNSPGTIDNDYRGEIGIILMNHSDDDFVVKSGMRLAQLVVCPVEQVQFQEVEEFSTSDRGEGGYGSTGT